MRICLTIRVFIPAVKKTKKHPSSKRKNSLSIARISFVVAIVSCIVLAVVYIAKPFSQQPFCANSISCIKDLSGAYDPHAKTGIFMGKKVTSPQATLAQESKNYAVLGESTGGAKHIYVDLSTQTLYAKEGDEIIFQFPVSTGLWGRTPTGDFTMWTKLRYTRMTGGNQALGTYYDLPNVPYTMFFYNDTTPKSMGYSIHGAYWHNNFGHPMSHGCINMRIEDVAKLYYWADPPVGLEQSIASFSTDTPSTPITVYGVAPSS